jgi:hypothetical protein
MTDLGYGGNYGSNDSYFFLKRELDYKSPQAWKEAKKNGLIRHCIIHDGKFYDYIINKHYDSLTHWIASCGGFMCDVLYGTNRVHIGILPKYVTLGKLLFTMGYWPGTEREAVQNYNRMNPEEDEEYEYPDTEDEEDYSDMPALIPIDPGDFQEVDIPEMKPLPPLPGEDLFTDVLRQVNMPDPLEPLPLNGTKCLVQRPDQTIVIARFMDYKFYDLEAGGVSRIFLSIPESDKFMNSMYFRLSELPQGYTVFIKTRNGGHFQTLQNLLDE